MSEVVSFMALFEMLMHCSTSASMCIIKCALKHRVTLKSAPKIIRDGSNDLKYYKILKYLNKIFKNGVYF